MTSRIDILAGKTSTWGGAGSSFFHPEWITDGYADDVSIAFNPVEDDTYVHVDAVLSVVMKSIIIYQNFAEEVELLGSDDDVTYTSIEVFSVGEEPSGYRYDLTYNTTPYRYYKLRLHVLASGWDEWVIYHLRGLIDVATGQQSNQKYLAYDNFLNAVDYEPLTTLTSGQDWWQNGDATVGQWVQNDLPYPQVNHNHAWGYGFNAPPQNHLFCLVDVGKYDYTVDSWFEVRSHSGSTGILFRGQRAGDFVTGLLIEVSSSDLNLVMLDDTGRTLLANQQVRGLGDKAVFGVELHGPYIVVTYNGFPIISHYSTFQQTGTLVGFSQYDASGEFAEIDVWDFYVRPHNPPAFCGPSDIVFIVDTTGSMGDALDSLKAGIQEALDDIETVTGGNYRLALLRLDTSNYPGLFAADAVYVEQNFALGNRTAFAAAVDALVVGDGGSVPEASDEALRTAIYTMLASERTAGYQIGDFDVEWRAGVAKFIILITDNVPGGFDDTYADGVDDVNAHAMAIAAGANSIRIGALLAHAGYYADTVNTIMQDYATVSGGIFIRLSPESRDTAAAVRRVIALCGGTIPTLREKWFGQVIG